MADEDGEYLLLRLWCQRLTFAVSCVIMSYVLFVLYTLKSQDGSVMCPDFRFDKTYLHKDLQIEEDGYILTNKNRLARQKDGQLKQYRGVVGAVPLSRVRKIILGLHFLVSMKKKAGDRTSILNVGFVHRQYIDTPGQALKGVLVSITECPDKKMCLVVKKKDETIRKIPLFSNYKDSVYSGRLIIVISSSSLTIAFTAAFPFTEIAYIFKDIDIKEDMWPFYGVFSPDIANVTITFPDDYNSEAVFDKTTCHDKVFISSDGHALSNVRMGDNFQTGYKVGRQLYRGALGDMSFQVNQLQYHEKPFYFAVQITGDIEMRKMKVRESFIEIGFAPKHVIEKHSSLRYHKKACSLCFSRCSTLLRTCVEFIERGDIVGTMADSLTADEFDLFTTISIIIDPNNGRIIFYGPRGDIWREYRDVDFSIPLFPVLGMTDKSFMKMRLLTGDKVPNYNILGYFGRSPVCDM